MTLNNDARLRTKHSLLFDVITINYNNRRGLFDTIASLEYIKGSKFVGKKILIDGYSSDLTDSDFEIFSQTYDIIIRESDKGIYDAMNKGLLFSSSPHVLMLNSGDTLLEDSHVALESLDLVSSKVIYAFPWRMDKYYFFPKSLIFLYLGNCCYCHQSLLLPKELKYKLNYKISGDLELLLRSLRLKYTIKNVNYPLSRYEGGGVSSFRSLRKLFEKTTIVLSLTPFYLLPACLLYNVLLFFKLQKLIPVLEPLKTVNFK